MCGRFALYSKPSSITQYLDLPDPPLPWEPRYNVAPGTWVTVIRSQESVDEPEWNDMWWGYRPHWAGAKAPQPINARAERLGSSRYFRGAFLRHRCLIPADGWYEWLPGEGGKQPYYLCRADRQPLFFAGIWSRGADDALCCAIITEPARGVARQVHVRMPLALNVDSLSRWLDPALKDRDSIRSTVKHLDDEAITCWPVSRRVNAVTNDDDSLIDSIAEPSG